MAADNGNSEPGSDSSLVFCVDFRTEPIEKDMNVSIIVLAMRKMAE